jgi:zinc transport system permease protein
MILIITIMTLISFIFAPLGCISLWKKYTYFGDGLAHASLLAGTISIIIQLPIFYAGSIVAIVFAILVFVFQNKSDSNAIILLISSCMLALALVVGYMNPLQVNITNLLFGDILSASYNDMIALSIMLIIILLFIWHFYEQIVLTLINRDIARIRRVKVRAIELAFLALLSLSVFCTIKIVGSLLVTSILLAPAMTARLISSYPAQMIIISILISLAINLVSIVISFHYDIPITPIITIINSIIYGLIYSGSYYKRILDNNSSPVRL